MRITRTITAALGVVALAATVAACAPATGAPPQTCGAHWDAGQTLDGLQCVADQPPAYTPPPAPYVAPTAPESPLIPAECRAALVALGDPGSSAVNAADVALGADASGTWGDLTEQQTHDDLANLRWTADQLGVTECDTLPAVVVTP